MVDIDENRLATGRRFGAGATVNSSDGNAAAAVLKLTGGRGADTVIEAVGIPATFELCQNIVAAGGTIANVGVHGKKVDLHLQKLWSHNITITTGLVDTMTIPMLLKTVQSKRIDAAQLITHHFKLGKILDAYNIFGNAANTHALKVIIDVV
jgi:alcohol dehydrogenase